MNSILDQLSDWFYPKKNALLLFHGPKCRPACFSPLDLNYRDYHCMVVDKNPATKPEILGDVSNPNTYREIADNHFDVMIIFSCSCCTKEPMDNFSATYQALKRVIKPGIKIYHYHASNHKATVVFPEIDKQLPNCSIVGVSGHFIVYQLIGK